MFYKEIGLNPKKPYMISFVGGGGKTSHMLRLANELKKFGNVLVTTTTKILIPEKKDYDNLVILENNNLETPEKGITVLAKSINKDNKIVGVDKDYLDNLYSENRFQFILIEADGAKEKPLKAPNETEPIIPLKTNINIGIIGGDALDRKINAVCFREDIFNNITGKSSGDLVDDESIVKLLNHDKGLFKDTPKNAKRYFIISKCDDNSKRERARILLNKVLSCKNIDKVFLTSIHKNFIEAVSINVCGVIMGSGLSRRMGSNKLLMELQNESMIEKVVRESVSSHLKSVAVVYNKDEVRDKVEGNNIEIIYNKSPEVGQSMSIKVGLEGIHNSEAEGYMFLVGDQPLVDSRLINSLLNKFKENKDNIILPKYKGINGNPVIFPSILKDKLSSLSGDLGGREIIKGYGKVTYLDVESSLQGFDVDTKEDYQYIKDFL